MPICFNSGAVNCVDANSLIYKGVTCRLFSKRFCLPQAIAFLCVLNSETYNNGLTKAYNYMHYSMLHVAVF